MILMLCTTTNSTADLIPGPIASLSNADVGPPKRLEVKSQPQLRVFVKTPNFILNPVLLVGLEMSLVPQVEKVFVDRAEGRDFRVIVVVNERDPAIRSEIYKREQALIDHFKDTDFDFNIVARQNRDLCHIIDCVGELAFTR